MNAGVGIAAEPLIVVHSIAFYGDQASASVGRGDLHFDFFAGLETLAFEVERELGVSFQIAGQIARSGDCVANLAVDESFACLLYTSPSPRDGLLSRMPSSA